MMRWLPQDAQLRLDVDTHALRAFIWLNALARRPGAHQKYLVSQVNGDALPMENPWPEPAPPTATGAGQISMGTVPLHGEPTYGGGSVKAPPKDSSSRSACNRRVFVSSSEESMHAHGSCMACMVRLPLHGALLTCRLLVEAAKRAQASCDWWAWAPIGLLAPPQHPLRMGGETPKKGCCE